LVRLYNYAPKGKDTSKREAQCLHKKFFVNEYIE
jgi:hypothetical protein